MAVGSSVISGVGTIIEHLPTGTVFLFHFLSPLVTNDGNCHTINKYLSSILVAVCGFSCCFSCFTDSYTPKKGETHYGIVTRTGLWPSSGSVDLSGYKLRFGDFVHAVFAVLVFNALVLLDTNTVECFYPSFGSNEKMLVMVLPPVIGVISGVVFTVFPNKRHGIGYPSSSDSSSEQATITSSLLSSH